MNKHLPHQDAESTSFVGCRVAALDSIRGIAVVWVFAHHTTELLVSAEQSAAWTIGSRLLLLPLQLGWAGVDLFFVLSGTLITGILLETKGDPHYLSNFYARRTLRIFPLYYGVLVGVFVVIPLAGVLFKNALGVLDSEAYINLREAQVWFWTYTHNYYQAGGLFRAPGLGHFWTLAIEEQFYLFWPIVVGYLSRRWLTVTVVVGCLLVLLLRIALLLTGTSAWAIWHLTHTRLDCLLYGALVAIAVSHVKSPRWSFWQRRWPAACAAFLLSAIAIYSWADPMHVAMQTIGYSLIAFCFAQWVARQFGSAENQDASSKWWDIEVLRMLGRLSYAIYIFHWPVLIATRFALKQIAADQRVAGSAALYAIIFVTTAGLTTITVALASWYGYERHWLKLKKYFRYASEGDQQ